MDKLYAIEVYVNNAPSEWHVSFKRFGKPSYAVTDTKEQAELIAKAINSHQAMKEALELLLHEPMSERAVDKAKKALTLANGEDKEP